MSNFKPTDEQKKVLDFNGKNLIVSASAGSGKTSTLIEFITRLVQKGQPIKRILLLTFTKAASFEMKERLLKNFYEQAGNQNILDAIDDVPTSDICTIHAFLERMIKKNTNSLPIKEGFIVLGEDEIKSLRERAFELCEKEFKRQYIEDYNYLYLILHNDRSFMFNMLNDMSSFFSSQTKAIERINEYKTKQKDFFEEALQKIDQIFLPKIKSIRKKLLLARARFEEEKYLNFIDKLLVATESKENVLNTYRTIVLTDLRMPPCSKTCDQVSYFCIKDEYEKIKEIKAELSAINVLDDRIYDKEQFGKIENIIYDFYLLYEECFSSLKEKLNAVDFGDFEKFAKEVLSNNEIRSQIQTDYDFIFVDEYQDTNKVQEEIIKEIAKKAHFVAVGDPKQGIYGFRNATSEIIKKDIKDFIADKTSSAEFLRKNFRSDAKILNFVNNVFVNIMKEETVGIDYANTSMLIAGDEKQCLYDETLPAVRIDIVKPISPEEQAEEQAVYDILQDEDLKKSSKNLEAKVIATRIQELLLKQIYDGKLKQLRRVSYKDIMILTRGKSELVNEIIKELTLAKIPVVSDIKGNFKDYAEILVLINLFKLMLDFQDDTSLISVMLSKIGGFNVDELAKLKLDSNEKEFYKTVLGSSNEKVKTFLKLIDNLKFKFECKGAFVMLEDLFDEIEYREYILSKPNAKNYIFVLDKFMQQIKTSKFIFDLPALVQFLDQEKINFKGGGNSANAVSICTIHSSKGLEFPIVILADTGKNILQPNRDKYVLNSNYGFAINYFSREEDEVYQTPLVYLLKRQEKERELSDEIMLLYVAMTRAQQHLYIVGTMQEKVLTNISEDPLEAKSYIEMILSGYKKLQFEHLKDELQIERVECNEINEVEEFSLKEEKFIGSAIEEYCKAIKGYLDFEYPYKKESQIVYKNSVSSLNENSKPVGFIGGQDDEFVDRGNAYHLALKLIDFGEIETIDDVEKAIEKLNDQNINQYVESKILYNNIKLLQGVLSKTKQLFKEKQFTSLVNLKDVYDNAVDEEIMVQGIVDLFALGEENVLIDYKFTNDKSETSLKKRYEKQLILYKNAIENSFKIKINKVFLLSLKNNKLINF